MSPLPEVGFFLKKAPSCDRLIASIAKAQDKYLDKENINNALKSLSENSDKDMLLYFRHLQEILLEKTTAATKQTR